MVANDEVRREDGFLLGRVGTSSFPWPVSDLEPLPLGFTPEEVELKKHAHLTRSPYRPPDRTN